MTIVPNKHSCATCQTIYNTLSQHILNDHSADISSTSAILNNILLNVLTLTTGNHSDAEAQHAGAATRTSVSTVTTDSTPIRVIAKQIQSSKGIAGHLQESVSQTAAGNSVSSGASVMSSITLSQAYHISASPVLSPAHASMTSIKASASDVSSYQPDRPIDATNSAFLRNPTLPNMQTLPTAGNISKETDGQAMVAESMKLNVGMDSRNDSVDHASHERTASELTSALSAIPFMSNSDGTLSMNQFIGQDGFLTPAALSFLIANQNIKDIRGVSGGQMSGKSDLDVADILVNKMPIPSLNKALDPSLLQLSTLYLRQLAFNQQQQQLQQLQQQQAQQVQQLQQQHRQADQAELPQAQYVQSLKNSLNSNATSTSQSQSDQKSLGSTTTQINQVTSLLTSLSNSLSSKDIPSFASQNDSMEQLIARHKQISNLIEYLTNQTIAEKSKAISSRAANSPMVPNSAAADVSFNISGSSCNEVSMEVDQTPSMVSSSPVPTAQNQQKGPRETANMIQGLAYSVSDFQIEKADIATVNSISQRQSKLRQPVHSVQHQLRASDGKPSEAVRLLPSADVSDNSGSSRFSTHVAPSKSMQTYAFTISTIESPASSATLATTSMAPHTQYLAALVPVSVVPSTKEYPSIGHSTTISAPSSSVLDQSSRQQRFLALSGLSTSYAAADYNIGNQSFAPTLPVTTTPVDHVTVPIPSAAGADMLKVTPVTVFDDASPASRLFTLLKSTPVDSVASSLAAAESNSVALINKHSVAFNQAAVDGDPKAMLMSLQTLINRTISGNENEHGARRDVGDDERDDGGKQRYSAASMVPLPQYDSMSAKPDEEAEQRPLYQCKVCSVTFGVLSTLNAHEKTHLGEQVQECNFCYETFRNAAEYEKHIAQHRGEESILRCSFCPKIFTTRGDYQKHMIEHTQRRPYACSHCQKAFRDPGSLVKHERIHTGERPYKCDECSRSFAEYSSLRKHLRTHSGEKPYKCQSCNKAFSISGNLQRHMFIHTGQRPYKCTLCSKAFNNPSHLRRHIKNLHGEADAKAMVEAASVSISSAKSEPQVGPSNTLTINIQEVSDGVEVEMDSVHEVHIPKLSDAVNMRLLQSEHGPNKKDAGDVSYSA